MKNVKNLFGMAVMATALVGCSSNDNLNPNPNDNAGKAGEAYAKFTIQLPTVSGTRADDPKPGTPLFEGGTADEYAVKNAQLVIFQKLNSGDPEGAYKFVETVNIGNLEPWTNNTPNTGVTRYANITAQLNGVSLDETGNKYYALVILNNAGQSKVKLPESGTYSEWNKAGNAKSAADFLNSDNGFYMANAPLYSTGEPTTLVPINGVYSTKAEAQNKPATTVYVERGMAKVTIGSSTFDADKPVTTSTNYAGDKVTITNWTLDVLNKTTFPVHVTTGLKTDFEAIWTTPRFVATGSTPQRVYWGVDPNYDKSTLTTVEACQDEFYIVDNNGKTYNGDPSSTFTWSEKTTPLYCLENTFDLDNMKQGQTTRVVFKATYTPHNLTPGDKTFFMIGNNTQIWTKNALVAQITSKAKEMLNSTDVVVTVKDDAPLLKGGSHLLSSADVTIKDGSVDKTETFNYATLNTKLGLDNTDGIKTYENGVCYYIARIKHFNELTPWKSGKVYGTDNVKYLGRYGVLRNNWYNLTVSKVSAPGYPDVPVVKPETTDDEDTKYINVEVKILDWAKRSQSVEL
ncbi:Mfa1 family fimbria major subunit [Prevotella sp.]|uniref:Mfa1 family fimbria major subunit n=1 Tax=Prevotella sp. TaxID=59823 RepID=UPI0027E22C3C|nr:Mfa1 family fimbria major subunit [Prevotella sp.]